jgi:hypothetical protein
MSDFDSRFILSDDMSVDDWCTMSTAIGETHLALCEKYPCWVRNLEHLPGVNLTWSELSSERSYYPEYHQWTYYQTERPRNLGTALERFAGRAWDEKDEYFHLKKFCLYFGRYDREIDPAINLGVHENKYSLHSRVMHYFNPPVMSAICVLERKNLCGKMDAFEIAERRFPELHCWDLIREILHGNYETEKWYREPDLTQLEDALEDALHQILKRLRDAVTLIPEDAGIDIDAWRQALAGVKLEPALVIFDNAKFSRLMKGRLHFYGNAPPHFDTTWLIQNELRRIGNSFFRVPFRTFWEIRTGNVVEDPAEILDELKGDPLNEAEIEGAKAFARLTPGHWEEGKEAEVAAAIVDVFDDFFRALNKISEAV